MASPPQVQSTDGTATDSARGRLSALVFLRVEHAIYLALGALLAITALIALFSAATSVWSAARSWGDPDTTIGTIDRLLFVLMLLEILHTVRVSVRSGELTCEPFLIVGLIASIRRVLVITLGSSQATQPGNWTQAAKEQFNASMMELGVLGVLILVMVLAIYLLRRGGPVSTGASTGSSTDHAGAGPPPSE